MLKRGPELLIFEEGIHTRERARHCSVSENQQAAQNPHGATIVIPFLPTTYQEVVFRTGRPDRGRGSTPRGAGSAVRGERRPAGWLPGARRGDWPGAGIRWAKGRPLAKSFATSSSQAPTRNGCCHATAARKTSRWNPGRLCHKSAGPYRSGG